MTFAGLLCVVDGVERIIEDTRSNHAGGFEILNSSTGGEVSAKRRGVSHRGTRAQSASVE